MHKNAAEFDKHTFFGWIHNIIFLTFAKRQNYDYNRIDSIRCWEKSITI